MIKHITINYQGEPENIPVRLTVPEAKWVAIKGYEGLYEVSNYGDVRSLLDRYHTGGLLKPVIFSNGYAMVTLAKDKVRKQVSVHRLVAEAFLPNPENKPQVNHLDFDRTNNNVENLEWSTGSENTQHAVAGGRFDRNPLKNNNTRKLGWEEVIAIRNSDELQSVLAERFGVNANTISRIKSGDRWQGDPPEEVYQDAAHQDAIKLLLDDPNVSTALKNVLDEDYWKREAREDPDRFMEGWDFGPDPIEQMESEDWDYEDWSRGV